MRGKQEIECQGALFAPDGGLRVSLKGTERQRERETEEKIIKQKKRVRKGEEREGGRYSDNKRRREYRCRDTE